MDFRFIVGVLGTVSGVVEFFKSLLEDFFRQKKYIPNIIMERKERKTRETTAITRLGSKDFI